MERVKRQRVEETVVVLAPPVGRIEMCLLRAIGESMHAFEFAHSPTVHRLCLHCGRLFTSDYVYAPKVDRVIRDGVNRVCFQVRCAEYDITVPLLCGLCGAWECTYNKARLIGEHDTTKAVLQTLPLPIFEEVWNHVGWEECIKT
jgi:hypothetical protein